MRYGEDDLTKKLSSKSGITIKAKAIEPGPKLCMFLDEDRDGAIDDEPANITNWEWGDCKKGDHKGAILLVKNQTYNPDENITERLPLKIDWDDKAKTLSSDWSATLEIIENPDQIRIYNNVHQGARQVLGKGVEDGLFAIHLDDVLPVHLNAQQAVILWMEAVDYPQKADGSDACVTLQLKFTDLRFKGLSRTTIIQEAQVRITPWIMASDLDETKVVFARAPKSDKCIAKEIEKFTNKVKCVFRPIKDAKKGFFRDVIKSGYVTWSGDNTARVVLERLDHSALLKYYNDEQLPRKLSLGKIGDMEDVALATVPKSLDKWPFKWRQSQDNGGNYLVSPSTEEHPWGRIIFGEGIKYVNNYVCNLGEFLCAQRLQEPIILDPTWLRVGHVDEIIAFIPRPYKILISSSRLAYSLLYGIAWALSQPKQDFRSDYYMKLINANARAIENEIRKTKYTEKYGSDYVKLLEKYFGKFSEIKNKIADGAKETGKLDDKYDDKNKGYKPDDPPPQGFNGRMITPRKDGLEFDAKDIAEYIKVSEGNIVNTELLKISLKCQQFIDEGSREILKKELKKEDLDFIDMPVLFGQSAGGVEALTGDSTNMLILVKDNEPNCLIAKPFGPVYDGKYVFQEYMRERLISEAKLKESNIVFANNWADMHSNDGEIHCGTNQLPVPLPENKRKWWKEKPPEIVARTLREQSKREITDEPKLKVKFVKPPEGCFIDPSETEIELNDTVANENLEFECNNNKEGDVIKINAIISRCRGEGLGSIKTKAKDTEEIAIIKAIPKLHISFKGEPEEGCVVDEISSELTLDNAEDDKTIDYYVTDLTEGRQIKISDVWSKLCSVGPAPDYTIREPSETVIAEIVKKVDFGDGIPTPPPFQ